MQDFTILVVPGAYATSVAVTQNMLQATAALAPRLKLPQPRWRVVSPDGGPVPLSGGLVIETVRMPMRASADASTWIVPGLGVESPLDMVSRFSNQACVKAASSLRRHVEGGGPVAASCSGVFLLQTAGLLQGRRATTSWWLASELRRLQPDCEVDADRMVVSDGLVTTAGAAFAHSDLMLHLLRARCSPGLADAVGKVLLIDGRQAQSRFVVPSMLANGNELIGRLTQFIESALPNPPTIGELADAFAMSHRTLSRHVHAATGQGPLALIQAVRLNRARLLIENSRMSVEQVAQEVGYGDATALRRLVRQATGVNPSAFRSGATWR
ncbi:helix-turn-helix domain-containing protein [Acidovorax sp. SUPP2539]|uniref:GlxA family transcriptional regulator n=1 Tax=Acidovorax sp. SUPP2539 TaxID=2920878 RepID=UPI0023DE1A39|nr:helix-turn-helix domain-containing protein [Acidovorax sp. SUPP2539]GKS91483.1 helix-turn-helix domain-containing protein [Acidovorax sp. SUPP2539]